MPKPFVNRTKELKELRQAVRYDGETLPVLVFTGIGGMGKSAIRIAFEEKTLKPHKIPYAVLNYDGDPSLRSIEATLRAIRRQIGRHGIRTPVFDFLYARYFELHTGVKLSFGNFPAELADVVHILEGIPVVGNVTQIMHGITRLGLRVKQRLQHKEWLYHLRELEPREVLNLLPEVLAEDLEEAASHLPKAQESSAFRISLLFDAFERLSESQVDDTLHRKLLLLTPHLLRVVFTRDSLPWEHRFSEQWRGRMIQFPPLEVLSSEDANVFLQQKNVENPELRTYLYQLTGGYPLHLELCCDICREIEETTGSKPQVQDFQGTVQAMDLTEGLVNRLLRQLKADERDLMGLAAYPRWVSEEVLEVLSSVPESVARIFRKFAGLSMFSPHPEIEEAFILRKEVRDFLISEERGKRLWKKRHGILSRFHKDCWEEVDSFHHLREALYHGFYEDPEEAMRIFEEHFWKLLERFCFGEAEGLVEAVPAETLIEKAKRKVDYARARLLTASARSQRSLETARQLYEELVASETDEDSLGQYFFDFGCLMQKLAAYGKALEYHKKGLAIRLKVYGEEHPDVALSCNNISRVYADRGEYGKGLEYHQRSLAILLKVYGEEHPAVALSYHNIGRICVQRGEHEKALEYYQRSLAIRVKVYGEEHPDVAASYNNIGNFHWRRGEYGKALEYLQRSLAIWLKVYGEERPAVATCYTCMGRVYSDRGEWGEALECYQRSLAIGLKVCGEEDPHVADSYHYLGCFYLRRGEYGKALEYLQRSLAIWLKVYGKEHPDVAASYSKTAHTLRALKKEEEAVEKIRRSVEIYCKFCLWKNAVEGLDTLAGWLEEMGRKKESEETRKQAHQLRKDHGLPEGTSLQ